MYVRLGSMLGVVIAGVLLAPRASRAEVPQNDASCFLARHTILLVQPHYERRHDGRARFEQLVGAEVLVAPRLDVSPEGLRDDALKQLQGARSMTARGCLDDVAHVRIAIDPGQDVISVRLLAADPSRAQEVLRRAHALVER